MSAGWMWGAVGPQSFDKPVVSGEASPLNGHAEGTASRREPAVKDEEDGDARRHGTRAKEV